MTLEFTTENKKRVDDILSRYPIKKAALLPIMWLAQEQFKTITREVMDYVAKIIEVEPIHVYKVTTFYTMFNVKPVGKYHLQLCRTLSCALLGSETLLDHLTAKLKIEDGQTTPDGKFTLTTVECLGSCGTGPAMMVNEKYVENLNVDSLDKLLEELK